MAALVDKLQETLVVAIIDAQRLALLYLGPDLARLETIEGNAAFYGLP